MTILDRIFNSGCSILKLSPASACFSASSSSSITQQIVFSLGPSSPIYGTYIDRVFAGHVPLRLTKLFSKFLSPPGPTILCTVTVITTVSSEGT